MGAGIRCKPRSRPEVVKLHNSGKFKYHGHMGLAYPTGPSIYNQKEPNAAARAFGRIVAKTRSHFKVNS